MKQEIMLDGKKVIISTVEDTVMVEVQVERGNVVPPILVKTTFVETEIKEEQDSSMTVQDSNENRVINVYAEEVTLPKVNLNIPIRPGLKLKVTEELKELIDTSVWELGLPTRACNRLTRRGKIEYTLGMLTQIRPNMVEYFLGKKTSLEVIKKVTELGLCFGLEYYNE